MLGAEGNAAHPSTRGPSGSALGSTLPCDINQILHLHFLSNEGNISAPICLTHLISIVIWEGGRVIF